MFRGNGFFGYCGLMVLVFTVGSPTPAGSNGMTAAEQVKIEDPEIVMTRSVVINAAQSLTGDEESKQLVSMAMGNIADAADCIGLHPISELMAQTRSCIDWGKLSTEDTYIGTAVLGTIQNHIDIGIEMNVLNGSSEGSVAQLLGWIGDAIGSTANTGV